MMLLLPRATLIGGLSRAYCENQDWFEHIVHDAPESVIHSHLMSARGVADRMFVPPTRARAVNRQTTGCVIDRAITTFADAVMESFCMVALELEVVGASVPCGLVVPSASCSFSFLSFQQLLTSCPYMSQCVQCFLPFSFSLLSLVFLEAFVKKAVAPAPDLWILHCSSFKICTLTSAGVGSTIE